MSASSISDIGPMEWIREASGKRLATILVEGIGGWWLAASGASIAGLTAVADFMFLPFRLGIDLGETVYQQLIVVPLRLTDFGFAITASELDVFGIFALPASTGLALGTIMIFIAYLALRITGNSLTGLVLDNPLVDFFFQTPEEEFEDED